MKKIITLAFLIACSSMSFAQTDSLEAIDTMRYSKQEETADTIVELDEAVLEIFMVEERAQFINGGDAGLSRFIGQNIEYPRMALDSGLSGMVMLQFVVEKNGSLSGLEAINRKIGLGLEEEAIRVVSLTSGKWTPAIQRNKPVRMRFRLPIKFKLD